MPRHLVLYATRELHVRAGLLGLMLGAGAVGGVLGSAVTRQIAAAIGVGRAYVLGCVGFTAPLPLVPLAGGRSRSFSGCCFFPSSARGSG